MLVFFKSLSPSFRKNDFKKITGLSLKELRARKNIILLRNDFLGDFVISMPVMEAFCRYYHAKGYRVILLTSRTMSSFARMTHWFDIVLEADQRDLEKSAEMRMTLYKILHLIPTEVFISLLEFSRWTCNDNLAYISNAKMKYGIRHLWPLPAHLDFSYKRGISFYDKMEVMSRDMNLAQVERNLLESISGEHVRECWEDLFFLPENIRNQEFIQGPYYIVVPGASQQAKYWETEKFAALIDGIAQIKPDLTTVFCGIEGEKTLGETIRSQCKIQTHFVNLCGKTNIPDLFVLLKKADFVISNDTGQSHIAALIKKKTYCITGSGHYGIYHPCPFYTTVTCFSAEKMPCFQCAGSCFNPEYVKGKPFPCISRITAEQVLNKIVFDLKQQNHIESKENQPSGSLSGMTRNSA